MPTFSPNSSVLSLSELLIKVRQTIAGEFPLPLWVRADMLKLNHYTVTGHAFPELVEKSEGKVTAKVQSVIWSGDLDRISSNFRAVTGKQLNDGISILFLAEVRFHEQFGMRLRILEIDAMYTLGQMAMEKKKTVERLKSEGLFDRNKSQVLAGVPWRLAVISAATSRGFSDLKNILRVEGAPFKMDLKLFTAVLQGSRGVETIAARIRMIGQRRGEFDAILIIRGGGDDTGMDCYDHYELARAVCECPLPVITGIGHSTNETVVEMVAHTNKITPTDVGYFILGKYAEQLNIIRELTGRLSAQALMALAEHDDWIENLTNDIYYSAREMFQEQKIFLTQCINVLNLRNTSIVNRQNRIIDTHLQRITSSVRDQLRDALHGNKLHQQQLQGASQRIPQLLHSSLNLLESKVNMLDPIQVLKRGYSITLRNGRVVIDASILNEGDMLETILHDSRILSVVQQTNKNNE